MDNYLFSQENERLCLFMQVINPNTKKWEIIKDNKLVYQMILRNFYYAGRINIRQYYELVALKKHVPKTRLKNNFNNLKYVLFHAKRLSDLLHGERTPMNTHNFGATSCGTFNQNINELPVEFLEIGIVDKYTEEKMNKIFWRK